MEKVNATATEALFPILPSGPTGMAPNYDIEVIWR
jgi:hypothetical protein